MLLTEIAVQNIAGFPPAARIALKAGLNAFVARDADVVALVRAVLYPGPDDARTLTTSASPRKAAVTIVGRDGHTYRVVRDFDKGRSLLASDPNTKQAVKLAEGEPAVAEALRTQVGLPGPGVFKELFLVAHADLPSQLAAKSARPVNQASTATTQAVDVVTTPEEARRRQPVLQLELEKALSFEQAQDAVFQMQNRLGELATDGGALETLERAVHELNGKAGQYARLRDVTGAVEQKIRRFPEAQARRDGALGELHKKQAEYEQKLVAAPDLNALVRDRVFAGGAGAGLLCVVLAVAMGMPLFWWLDLAGFGTAAFAAWRWVGEVEGADAGRRRLADLADLEKRIRSQYDAETQPVLAALRALGVNSTDEVLVLLEERDVVEARRVALVREHDALRADPRLFAIEQEREALKQQLKERESVVNSFGFSRDPALIRRELAACEELLGGRAADADPLAGPIELGAQLAGTTPPVLVDSFKERLAQYLGALTDRRFVGVRPVSPGVCHVLAQGGASGPISGLPPADRDLVFLGVRLALAERLGGPAKLPLVFDEPSLLVDGNHRGLFVKMLKALGGATQVLVRAYDAPPPGIVDHVARPLSPGEKAA